MSETDAVRIPTSRANAEASPEGRVLDDDLLGRIASRAAEYDRENRFFHEDLADLRAARYLIAAAPREFGGLGLGLPDILREQARLACRAPATALAINMHLYWVGAAAHLWRKGDHSAEWILEEAVRGATTHCSKTSSPRRSMSSACCLPGPRPIRSSTGFSAPRYLRSPRSITALRDAPSISRSKTPRPARRRR